MRRFSLAILAAAAVVFAVAAPASAVTPAEPNDDITQAAGPLASGTTYEGDFASAGDVDFLVFYVDGAQPLDVAVKKNPGGCSTGIAARLLNGDGKTVSDPDNPADVPSNTTRHITVNTPGSGRYYLQLTNDCAGDPYEVTVGPGAAIVTTSPHQESAPTTTATATSEPNDRLTQTSGPLGGQAYSGSFEVANDADFLVFHTAADTGIDVAITKVGSGCSQSFIASLLNADGKRVTDGNNPVTVGSNQIEHITVTASAGNRYYVKLTDTCAGDPYQVRISPASAVTTSPAVPAPTEQGTAVPEPNDALAQAFGPIAGNTTYTGSIDVTGDRDYYRMLVLTGKSPADVAVIKVGTGCSPEIKAALFEVEDNLVDDIGVLSDTITHLRLAPLFNREFFLRISGGCAGDRYQFAIADPGGALVSAWPAPPPPPGGGTISPTNSAACRSAKAAAKKAAANVRSAKRVVKRAKSRRAKVKAKRLLAKRKRQLKAAQTRQRRACR